jgi:hypothetical protein
MTYLIVNKKDREIVKTNDYSVYQNELESLGSFADCDFFHMASLTEEDYSNVMYTLTDSGEAPYRNYEEVHKMK